MGPREWKRLIGESAWQHILTHKGLGGDRAVGPSNPETTERVLAGFLTAAVEAGFIAPSLQPIVAPDGSKVLWPRPGTDDLVEPVLTAAGLARHYRNRGHGFLIMRVEQLLKAVAGPLLPHLQAIMFAYEEQCTADQVHPLPVDWRVFVGGRQAGEIDVIVHRRLVEGSPTPDPSAVQRKTFQPGEKA